MNRRLSTCLFVRCRVFLKPDSIIGSFFADREMDKVKICPASPVTMTTELASFRLRDSWIKSTWSFSAQCAGRTAYPPRTRLLRF